ncbi:MAG TPA: carboxymuconolactone decarboxylase family protein [Anaerolineae bacterium]|nr:carboxymuconolactone decarboxylase family protein [Anaerolineae bacterium]
MSDSLAMKKKFYDWANAMLAQSPFDVKTNHLMSMVAALARGDQGAVSYFYFSAKAAGASEAELAAATDIATAATGLSLYALLPKGE